jgi:hypothetical protein
MLPLPSVRAPQRSPLGTWLKRLDDYTLWAFNPPRSHGR